MTSKTLMQNIAWAAWCFPPLRLVACVAQRLGADSLLGGCLKYDETPMTVRTTDDALNLKHVLQESAEASRAFAFAACGLVTTGSRDVRGSDVGSAKLFETRSRIAQVLRTRL